MASGLNIRPAGEDFLRPGGRDGDWWPDPQDDDRVVSPFGFTVVSGRDADAVLDELRRTLVGTFAIVVGSAHDYGMLIEQIEDEEPDVDATLAEAKTFDLEGWFAGRVAEVQVWQDDLGTVVPPRGPWPRSPPFVTHLAALIDDTTTTAHETVYIALVPAARASDVLAQLVSAGWGDNPEPAVHVALAADWEARFGAVFTAIVRGSVEFQVARPPKTRDDAERLALEHFHYSREAVPGTLQAAAASLVGSTVWRFSWD